MKNIKLLPAVTLMMLIALPDSVLGASSVSSFGKAKSVGLADYLPHLKDNESYSETWSHGVWTDDGRFMIGVDFVISNLGVGDHNGAVSAEYVDDAGKKTKCKVEYDSDEWSWSKDRFALKFGSNTLEGGKAGLQISLSCKNLKMDLKYENEVDPIKPGSGQLRFGDNDGSYNMVFTSPRAKVTGTVTRGNQKFDITGIGYADHSYMDIAPYDQARRWFRFKSIKKDLSVIFAEMETTEEYGRVTRGWAILADSNGKIVVTPRVNFSCDGFIKDTRSSEGYRIPRRVRLAAVEGTTQATGSMVMTKLKETRDPLAQLGIIKRAIVKRYTKPRDYYISCNVKLRIRSKDKEDRLLEDTGTYRFYYVNP
jgi:hydroxyneurosporene synthase CrtC